MRTPAKTTKKKAVVLLSGGIDSSTALAVARRDGYHTYAISFDYGQRHKRELESARMVASILGVKEHLAVSFDLRAIGGSALTSERAVPKRKGERTRAPGIPVTYVPARNTIFLSFALGWAEVLEAADIFIGANAVDYSGYPDCRPEYLKAFESLANLATKASVEGKLRFRIRAPLLSLSKSEIIREGMKLGLDYALTWSCYDPRTRVKKGETKDDWRHLIPCGRCDSCAFRTKGFREAGVDDPLLGVDPGRFDAFLV